MEMRLKASISRLDGRYVLELNQDEAKCGYIVRNIAFFHEGLSVKVNCLGGIAAFAADRKSYFLDITDREVSEADCAIIYLKDVDSKKCFELNLSRDAKGWATSGQFPPKTETKEKAVAKTVLVTGAAGFIGAFLCKNMLETTDYAVVGFDNCNDYYDPGIKADRLRMLAKAAGDEGAANGLESFATGRLTFIRADLADEAAVNAAFEAHRPDVVVNLGAQAGVRYSIENPRAYVDSNLVGFFNVLEACRASMGTDRPVEHLVYASSSSVYGGNKKVPFSEEDRVDGPVSLYAASKKSNELMANAYSKLYSIPCTGLRFFTVYGPMGRPDMAYFGFTDKLLRGKTIKIFNMGDCKRDFTYVDDIVEGVRRVMAIPPKVEIGGDGLPLAAHRVYNIGNSSPESLLGFVDTLQRVLVAEGVLPEDFDFEAHKQLVPMQPGDVPVTYADTSKLEADMGFKPSTSLEDGLRSFAKWYKAYYGI